ncbi:MAG: hypothetical protein HZC36_01225 [Armatimonadetes bacterium]|nr:hypothetical protein [Armatimonadota bacterium]
MIVGIGLHAGRRAGFSPMLLGPAMWFDASVASSLTPYPSSGQPPVNNDSITAWSDLSGNARHLSQGTSSKMPLYKTDVANGLPGVLFDSVDDMMTAANAIQLQEGTVLAVLNRKPSASSMVPVGGGYKAFGAGIEGTTGKPRVLKVDTTVICLASSAPSAGSAQFVAWGYQGGTTNAVLRINGSDVAGSVTNTSMADAATTSTVGNANGNYHFGDHLFEVCVLNRMATVAEVNQFYGYAKAKWGVP